MYGSPSVTASTLYASASPVRAMSSSIVLFASAIAGRNESSLLNTAPTGRAVVSGATASQARGQARTLASLRGKRLQARRASCAGAGEGGREGAGRRPRGVPRARTLATAPDVQRMALRKSCSADVQPLTGPPARVLVFRRRGESGSQPVRGNAAVARPPGPATRPPGHAHRTLARHEDAQPRSVLGTGHSPFAFCSFAHCALRLLFRCSPAPHAPCSDILAPRRRGSPQRPCRDRIRRQRRRPRPNSLLTSLLSAAA